MIINIVLSNPDSCIRAETVANDDGSYTIKINKNLSYDQSVHELIHELSHIKRNDFDLSIQANLIESMVRQSNFIPEEFEDINFYCHVV